MVKVRGGVGSFREVKQMLLERICTSSSSAGPCAATRTDFVLCVPTAIIGTTNEEVAAWAENTAFRKEVLDIPWVISEEEEKRARRKAEGLDREKRARGERKKRKRREEEGKGERERTVAEKEKRRGERKRKGEG